METRTSKIRGGSLRPRTSKIRGGYLRCGSIYSREPPLILDYRCDPDNLSMEIMYLITSFAKIIADCMQITNIICQITGGSLL